MKIVLINTPYSRLYGPMGSGGNYQYPLGLGYISAALKSAGHECRILDLEVLAWPSARLESFIAEYVPGMIGISCATPNYPFAQEIADACRRALPECLLIAGGVHVSALPEESLRQTPSLDLVAIGEGEATMKELAASAASGVPPADQLMKIGGLAWRAGDKIERSAPRPFLKDLDSLPHPDRSAGKARRYRPQAYADVGRPAASLISSRGCPYHCAFCASGVTTGSRFRAHSPDYVLEEIDQLWHKDGVRHFVFKDDTFTVDRERVVEFCAKLSKRNLPISWFCYARPDRVDKELLALMKKSGLRVISFGLESGDDAVLRQLDKGLDVARGIEALSWARELGIFTVASYILGLPGENEGAARCTIDCAVRGNPVLASFNRLVVYPGTPLYEKLPRKRGAAANWQDYVPTGPRLAANYSELSDKHLNALTKLAYRGFYLRPAKIFDILRNIHGLRHLLVFVRAALGFLRQLAGWGE